MSDPFLDIGTKVSLQKSELEDLLEIVRQMGYEIVGTKVKDRTVILAPIQSTSELPKGYQSHQEPGKYSLVQNGDQNYFDVASGPHAWKRYFFPPKSELMQFHKGEDGKPWSIKEGLEGHPRYAMLGVRPCDLAAIEIQDKVFIREDWCDPIYCERRSNSLLIAVNCMEPCDTCFCVSMGTGPEAKAGFDLCLTELENSFLVEIGSEAGRMVLNHESITWQPASAFMLRTAQNGLAAAREKMGRELPDPESLQTQLLENLTHPRWEEVAERCMSCTSCTQVCPTCFCWNAYDESTLSGDTVVRRREWDSCFNPDYSYVFGGNTRPSTYSRYRQWLTHKWASWYDQYGTSGCVGCGRCITWCPAGIDHIEEITAIRGGSLRKGESS
jgi:formate hydrogenlyase subunit 6/NADH:ubiquinone oxidoreductase subunit I